MTTVCIMIALCGGRAARWGLDWGCRTVDRSTGRPIVPVLFAAGGIIFGFATSISQLGQSQARDLIRTGLVVGFVSPRPFVTGANTLARSQRSDLATAYLIGSYILLLVAVATGYLLGHMGRVA